MLSDACIGRDRGQIEREREPARARGRDKITRARGGAKRTRARGKAKRKSARQKRYGEKIEQGQRMSEGMRK